MEGMGISRSCLCCAAEPFQPEDAASSQLGALAAQAAPPGQAGLVELGARWRALTAQASSGAQAALSLEAALLAERQVLALDFSVLRSRCSTFRRKS